MNRSVIVYCENLEEGVLGHLKRNWKKYALGAAAVGTGAMIANPALATSAGATVGRAATTTSGVVGNVANKVLSPELAKTVSGGVNVAGQAIKGSAAKAGEAVRGVTQNLKDRIKMTRVPVRIV
jgi:hypothetical protein